VGFLEDLDWMVLKGLDGSQGIGWFFRMLVVLLVVFLWTGNGFQRILGCVFSGLPVFMDNFF
jgi:hypothetical protein